MQELHQIIKKNVVFHRKKSGFSQKELAIKAGISTTYIGEIETCRKYPSVKTLEKIATALELEPYILLKDPDLDKNDTILKYNKILKNAFGEMIDSLASLR